MIVTVIGVCGNAELSSAISKNVQFCTILPLQLLPAPAQLYAPPSTDVNGASPTNVTYSFIGAVNDCIQVNFIAYLSNKVGTCVSAYALALSTDWYCLPATSGSVVLMSSALDSEIDGETTACITVQLAQS